MSELTTTKRREVRPHRLKAETERVLREAEHRLSLLAAELPEGDANTALAVETVRNLGMIRRELGSGGR